MNTKTKLGVHLIAEIGCNHMGSLEMAKKMVHQAKTFCQVDYVKFQKRNPKELLTPIEYRQPHPNPAHAFGESYGLHREALEFDIDKHRELLEYCQSLGIGYFTSVWDLTSAREVNGLRPEIVKIPSACNRCEPLLNYLCQEFAGDIHVSVGMTTRKEEEQIVETFEKNKRLSNLVIYSCTSGYPVKDFEVCLLEIRRLVDLYGRSVKGIGFSGHHNGIAIDIAAMALGAEWIERHFTLDRTLKGTDHAASLEPDGMRRLARDLKSVHAAMAFKSEEILPVETTQRKKLKRLQAS